MTMERIEICGPQDCTCPNDHPELDEFVATNVDVHFEALGTCQWYMHITDRDGRMWQVDFGAVNPRVRGYARIEEIPPVSASDHAAPVKPRLPLTISEQEFQRIVLDYAIARNWRAVHFRPARTAHGWRSPIEGHAGFPDLVLARGSQLLVRELKRHGARNRLPPDQKAWLRELGPHGGVWTPADWAEIVEELR